MITVYSKPSCPSCIQAKEYLRKKGIPFDEQVIGIHVLRETFLETFPNVKTVPLIVDDGIIVGGWTDLPKYMEENYGDGGGSSLILG